MGKKLTVEIVSERVSVVSENTLKLVENQTYEGKDSELYFAHVCGTIFRRSVGNVIHNKIISCPSCSPSLFTRTKEILQQQLSLHNIELISANNGYGDRSLIEIKLACGCILTRYTGNTVVNGSKCPEHSEGYGSWKTVESVEEELKQMPFGEHRLTSTFINSSKFSEFECLKCGHKTTEKFQTLKNRGGKCKHCFGSAKSVYEEYLAILLNDLGVKFIREYFVKGSFFDFYLPDYNIFIEYDGIQHVLEDGASLFAITNRDKIKNVLAESEGKSILRIPHTDSIVKSVLLALEGSTTIQKWSTLK